MTEKKDFELLKKGNKVRQYHDDNSFTDYDVVCGSINKAGREVYVADSPGCFKWLPINGLVKLVKGVGD